MKNTPKPSSKYSSFPKYYFISDMKNAITSAKVFLSRHTQSLHPLALVCMLLTVSLTANAGSRTVKLADRGIRPNTANDKTLASRLDSVLRVLRSEQKPGETLKLKLEKGVYHFYSADCRKETLFISNHDQNQPKAVGIMLDGWQNLVVDGQGAEICCHGRMLPIVLRNGKNCTLKRISVDSDNPQIAQVQVVKNTEEGITFEVAPWVKWRKGSHGTLETYGEDWTMQPQAGIAFEKDTRYIVFNTGDLWIDTRDFIDLGGNHLLAPNWKDKRLVPGTIVAMRSYWRPCPGIFMANDTATVLEKVTIHYAEGMGLIAQRCHDITLRGFDVALRGAGDPRYFTTQADATHFSQCSGHIQSEGGLYEHAMDDAINVHGIYLRIKEVIDKHTMRCRYEHGQSYGFDWGAAGDTVLFVQSNTMEEHPARCVIQSVRPIEGSSFQGVKEMLVTVHEELPENLKDGGLWGIENLSATPTVTFRRNIIRNNRARGALFSSPRRTVCEDNHFDHTSGAAIVLCGDCNGWFESGSVHDLVIRRNTFTNALTSLYQFTNAVISIYPEIPELHKQKRCFHGGKRGSILIEDNNFETFDKPLLYVKSTQGLVFRRNRLKKSNAYTPFHFNQEEIKAEHCEDCDLQPATEVR